MRAVSVPWSALRPGHLFKSRDDLYPLRVLATIPGGVLVAERGVLVRVRFRAGVRVYLFLGERERRGGTPRA